MRTNWPWIGRLAAYAAVFAAGEFWGVLLDRPAWYYAFFFVVLLVLALVCDGLARRSRR